MFWIFFYLFTFLFYFTKKKKKSWINKRLQKESVLFCWMAAEHVTFFKWQLAPIFIIFISCMFVEHVCFWRSSYFRRGELIQTNTTKCLIVLQIQAPMSKKQTNLWFWTQLWLDPICTIYALLLLITQQCPGPPVPPHYTRGEMTYVLVVYGLQKELIHYVCVLGWGDPLTSLHFCPSPENKTYSWPNWLLDTRERLRNASQQRGASITSDKRQPTNLAL